MSRFGPNGELNGTDIVLMIERPRDSGNYEVLAAQRGASFGEGTSAIDVSSKTTGRPFRGIPGRWTGTATLSSLYVPTQSGLSAIKTASRNGTKMRVRVRTYINDANDALYEQCDAVITNFNREAPDQDAAVVSLDLQLDGQWEDVVVP
jgi:TP901-1 family phage major tail protein